MNRYATFLVVLAAALLVGGAALHAAPAVTSYDIPWDAMTGGTEQMGSEHYTMYSTAGQAAVESSAEGGYQMDVGFWYGIPAEYKTYLPVVLRS